MKKILFFFLLLPCLSFFTSGCADNDEKDVWDKYQTWREDNEAWLSEMARLETPDGKAYYERVVPSWNPGVYILMHYHNDRTLTEDNLVPLETSTVIVKYRGKLYNTTEGFDSSYTNVSSLYGDSVYITSVSSVITGWQIALQNMHVGDSATILLPYNVGYGAITTNEKIPPYSALEFDVKLVDILYYQERP